MDWKEKEIKDTEKETEYKKNDSLKRTYLFQTIARE